MSVDYDQVASKRPQALAERDYGKQGSLRSVADIVDQASLTKVREFKKAMKAAAKAT